jgi:hypothetical protein
VDVDDVNADDIQKYSYKTKTCKKPKLLMFERNNQITTKKLKLLIYIPRTYDALLINSDT